ncbi:stage 0 sporulation family protein [Thermodesulfobacteriota bacterium]
MANIIGVKLRKQLRPIEATAGELTFQTGDKVMIETKNGPTLGTVIPRPAYKCSLKRERGNYSKVLGMAEEADLRQEELNIRMERDYYQVCKKKILKHKLPMKMVEVEIVTDGSKVVFYFVAENRVDFRQLVKELAADLRTRIEMRQIGARSEAQKIGGLGCCGRDLCCANFLKKFAPVTVRMTKEQGLPLDPEKISGVCGRLMCCLAYEYETYVELKQGLPKVGKRIKTPKGAGKIKQINIITKKITVDLEDGVLLELPIEEYTPDMLIKK